MSNTQYLTIKEVCDLQGGFGFESQKYREEGEPILRVTSLKNNQIDDTQLKFFNPLEYSKNLEKHLLHPNEIVISKDGTIGKVAFNNKGRSFYLSSQLIKVIPKKVIHTKYLFHFLISKTKEIEQMTTGKSAILHLNLNKFKELKISVPPLEEQREIANKLDKFWELSEELKEELDLRKKQYEYYRDELLSFKQDNKIKWLTLGEITNNTFRGICLPKKIIADHGVRILRYADLYDENKLYFKTCKYFVDKLEYRKLKYCQYGDILIARVSNIKENIAKACTYLGKDPILIDDKIIGIKHKQNSKYLAFAFSTNNARKQKLKLSKFSGLCTITFESIKDIKIPIPAVKQQEEIANLLDKFWKLSNDIKDGLPAQILLTKKQYEYYRELLLK